ncbi:hypothetical protein [Streptomyces sp. MMG1121]|uniref:hypothetical protein n=1 Tax=Streptomyces sp. MMG1121 TaxID=1415544 RepID=UPI0006AEB13C|nr:hypothetical protein [Streptomyces sp. MMG1121]
MRLLLVLAMAALPAYGVAVACAPAAYAVEPGAGTSTGPEHPHRPAAGPGHGHGHDRDHADRPGRSDDSRTDNGRPAEPGHDDRGSPADGTSLLPMPSDSASASYRPPADEPTRAGSLAGEGRLRPGRPDGPGAEVEGDDSVPTQAPGTGRPEEPETADLPTGAPTTPAARGEADLGTAGPATQPTAQNAVQQGEGAGGPVLRILPLGSGLVLIGLGLGLAFLGLRLRRD